MVCKPGTKGDNLIKYEVGELHTVQEKMSEETKQEIENSEATMRDHGNVARLNIEAENNANETVGNEEETNKNDVSNNNCSTKMVILLA